MTIRYHYGQDGALLKAYCSECGWSDECPFFMLPQPKSGIEQFKKDAERHVCPPKNQRAQGSRPSSAR